MSGKPGIRIDLTGQRFGRLVVICKASHDMKTGVTKWSCGCDCGNSIEVRGGNLRSGHSQSCGCLSRENASKTFKTHGKSHTRLFNIWCSMRQRCRDKNHRANPHMEDVEYLYVKHGIMTLQLLRLGH
jgi:hypothetical protein